jgi:CSLREA domain-containing protein
MFIALFKTANPLRTAAGALCIALLCTCATAATFTVNSTADTPDANPGDGVCATAAAVCTLRAAIEEANALLGDDQINVPGGSYSLASELLITSNINIVGSGITATLISGVAFTRIFNIVGVSPVVSLSDVRITQGRASEGGGIRVGSGRVTLLRTRVDRNGADSGAGRGGGIHMSGESLTVRDSMIEINFAINGGGGIYVAGAATLDMVSSSVQFNQTPGLGGGIASSGSVTTLNSTIAQNEASNGAGIAIEEGPADIQFTTFNNNTVTGAATNAQVYAATPNTSGLSRTFRGNIIANPVGGANCAGTIPANAVSSLGNNLDSSNSCGFVAAGDLSNANPLLGALGSCAGTTQGYALLSGSPAINAGPTTGALPVSDQSNAPFVRVVNAPGDIGACEFVGAIVPVAIAAPVPANHPVVLAIAVLALALCVFVASTSRKT